MNIRKASDRQTRSRLKLIYHLLQVPCQDGFTERSECVLERIEVHKDQQLNILMEGEVIQ